MKTKRHIEIFSAGCQVCEDSIALVNQLACPSCEITILDMKDQTIAHRARMLGMHTIPTVVIDGQIAGCCATGGPNEQDLRAAGIGTPLS